MSYTRTAGQRRQGTVAVPCAVRVTGDAGGRLRTHGAVLGVLLAAALLASQTLWTAGGDRSRAGNGVADRMTAERAHDRSAEACRLLLPPGTVAPVREVAELGNDYTGRVWQVVCGGGAGEGSSFRASAHLTWDAGTGELMDVATNPGPEDAVRERPLDASSAAQRAMHLAERLSPAGGTARRWRPAAGATPSRLRDSWIVKLEGAPDWTAVFSLTHDSGAVRFARFDRRDG